MVQIPSDEPWYCSNCCAAGNPPATSIFPAENIRCAVMNVRSIVEKRFDLCAYLATHQIDILAVYWIIQFMMLQLFYLDMVYIVMIKTGMVGVC